MFFGTPHRGLLNTDDILSMIGAENNERIELVRSIDKNSSDLQKQLQKFLEIAPRYKIISYYELKKSKTLVKVRSDASNEESIECSCTDSEVESRWFLEPKWRLLLAGWNRFCAPQPSRLH
jgi:hypothetical protein